jgi:hypothetical protein
MHASAGIVSRLAVPQCGQVMVDFSEISAPIAGSIGRRGRVARIGSRRDPVGHIGGIVGEGHDCGSLVERHRDRSYPRQDATSDLQDSRKGAT